MRIVSVRQPARCVACHDALHALALQAVCPACDARGHVDCLSALRGCPTLGCARRAPVVPSAVFADWPTEPLPPPPSRWARPRFGRIALVVGAFLLLVVAHGASSVWGQGHRARVQRVGADLQALRAALGLFRADTGREAERLPELWERPYDVRFWGPDPYLRDFPPRDPWGNEYVYTAGLGWQRDLVSLGADGAPGGQGEARDLWQGALEER